MRRYGRLEAEFTAAGGTPPSRGRADRRRPRGSTTGVLGQELGTLSAASAGASS
jgi:hypothetical protein